MTTTLDLTKPMRLKVNQQPFECFGVSRRNPDCLVGYLGDEEDASNVYKIALENIPETISLAGWYANVYTDGCGYRLFLYRTKTDAENGSGSKCIARHKWPFTEVEIGRYDE